MIGRKKYILVILLALPIMLFIAFHLKSEKKLVQARYLMLACENCNHMEVIKSNDENIISQTVIPESNTYNIEDLITESIEEKQDLCLEGYTYRLNFSNLWGIDPSGIRFKVEKSYPLSKCEKLYTKQISSGR